jgi:hypothetical protein
MMPPAELWDMLNAGDWACAHCDDEALERIASQVAVHVPDSVARRCRHVARLAPADMRRASRAWGQVADDLRHQTSSTPQS